MYILPQPHQCNKCGFTFAYGPHDPHPAPVIEIEQQWIPVCPKCYTEFIQKNLGLGYSTIKY